MPAGDNAEIAFIRKDGAIIELYQYLRLQSRNTAWTKEIYSIRRPGDRVFFFLRGIFGLYDFKITG